MQRRAFGLGGIAVIAVGLGLGLGLAFGDESPSHATTAPQPSGGAGAHPSSHVGPATRGCFPAPVRDICRLVPEYIMTDPRNHGEQRFVVDNRLNSSTWLMTIRNPNSFEVFVNEFYFPDRWAGETPLSPKQTKVIPLWSFASVYVGKKVEGGERPFVEITRWQLATDLHELWFRDHNKVFLPESEGSVQAVNASDFTVELHWAALGQGKWISLAPGGRSQTIPPYPDRIIEGKKSFGTGAAARVTFAKV